MAAKALLVGINDYAPAGPGGPDLGGCINDVRLALSVLTTLGTVHPHPAYTRVLTNTNATRAKILAGLEWLVKPAARVDRMIFYYSGHGTKVPDVNHDELDGYDEAICPSDFATAGVITDDVLRTILDKVPAKVTLEVILDSCFSGTGTREAKLMQTAPEEQRVTIRYVEPPLDDSVYLMADNTLPTRRIMRSTTVQEEGKMRVAVPVPGMKHVLWAACRDNQTAAEAVISGTRNGIFSYCFFNTLKQTGLNVPRRRIDSLVTTRIAAMGYSQVPQLEGTAAELGDPIFRELSESARGASANK